MTDTERVEIPEISISHYIAVDLAAQSTLVGDGPDDDYERLRDVSVIIKALASGNLVLSRPDAPPPHDCEFQECDACEGFGPGCVHGLPDCWCSNCDGTGRVSRPDADTVPVPRSELWALHDGITRRYVSFDTIAHALSDWLLGEESR